MILSAGLSPAWQQILRFDSLRVGEVNRARESAWCASGKVINVAVAAARLGEPVALVSALGGLTGDAIQRELQLLGIDAEWIQTSEPTRVCTTILDDSGPTTELVENMPAVEPEVLEDFVDRARVYANVADVSVLTGSLPADAPPELFARVLRNTPNRCLLDIRGPALEHCLAFHPFLIKPNREELQATLQQTLDTERELVEGMQALNARGAQWLVISDGPRAVYVTSSGGAWRLTPPAVRVVNPIGCGDCLAAGIASGLRQQLDVLAAVQLGIGAAGNNAEHLLPARLDRGRCEQLAELVEVEPLD